MTLTSRRPFVRRFVYLLAATAVVGVLFGLGLLALDFRRRFRIPRAFVPVTAFAAVSSSSADSVRVFVRRASYHPAQQVSTSGRFRSDARGIPEYIEIDGAAELDDLAPRPFGMLGHIAFTHANADPLVFEVLTEGNNCVSAGWPTEATSIAPGGDVRFTVRLFVESNEAARKIRDSILGGTLPGFRFGHFKALSEPSGLLLSGDGPEDIAVEFATTPLSREGLRDFFPFGEPLAGDIGPNKRLYWRSWLSFAPLPDVPADR